MTGLTNIWKNRGRDQKTPVTSSDPPLWGGSMDNPRQRSTKTRCVWNVVLRRMLRIQFIAKRTNVSILSQLKINTRFSNVCDATWKIFGHANYHFTNKDAPTSYLALQRDPSRVPYPFPFSTSLHDLPSDEIAVSTNFWCMKKIMHNT